MKAAVIHAVGRGFSTEEIDVAKPLGREVLVDVQARALQDALVAPDDRTPREQTRHQLERAFGIEQKRILDRHRRTTLRPHLAADEAELQRRTSAGAPVRAQRGYDKLYAEQILGADEGCDFAFLRAPALAR